MRELTVLSALMSASTQKASVPLRGVDDSRGWTSLYRSGGGFYPDFNFQRNIEIDRDSVLANWAVFACITRIASDIGKLALDLVEMQDSGIWVKARSNAFTPVLRKPNRYQTRQQFIEQWITSKLTHGNTYVLLERDARQVVMRMHVLDPCHVRVLVAPDGSVYYQLNTDELAGITEHALAVPASEIIHDRMNCLFHPLVGLSPIFANGLAATQGLAIQNNSAKFFENMSRPSGVLTAPAQISDDTAKRIKEHWDTNYSGEKIGKVAVLGDGLKYEAMTVNADDAQLVEQLKMSAEMVCSTFHVPAFKIGAGTIPSGQKVEDLNQIYYADCLQPLIEAPEALLDEGLGLNTPKDGIQYGTMFDLDALLRMDAATMTNVLKEQVGAGILKLDEARRRLNYGPMTGGNAAYLQQQYFSVEALADRDKEKPFSKPAAPVQAPAAATEASADDGEEKALNLRSIKAIAAEAIQKAMQAAEAE